MPIYSEEELKQLCTRIASNDPTLTGLDLSYNQISDEGAARIAEALKINQTLTEIHLNDNYISDEGAARIAEALKINQTLTEIHLNDNYISDEGAARIAEALKINQTISWLNLSNNYVSDNGAIRIVQGLEENRTVTRLYLDDNQISEEFLAVIGDLIAKINLIKITNDHSPNLNELNLSGNHISDEGATIIAETLTTNTTLTALDLSLNNIFDEGVVAIIQSLEKNKTLTWLDLAYNKISDVGAVAIAEALEENTIVTALNLDGNNISEKILTRINSLIERNKKMSAEEMGEFAKRTHETTLESFKESGDEIKDEERFEFSEPSRKIQELQQTTDALESEQEKPRNQKRKISQEREESEGEENSFVKMAAYLTSENEQLEPGKQISESQSSQASKAPRTKIAQITTKKLSSSKERDSR